MAGRRARSSSNGSPRRCSSCGTPIHRHTADRAIPLDVTADLRPLTPAEQAEARTRRQVIYCLRGARLTYAHTWHNTAACPHPHLTDHHCTPAEPSTLF